jgi:DNA-directed RNA polymerase specialized sigma24 family protein
MSDSTKRPFPPAIAWVAEAHKKQQKKVQSRAGVALVDGHAEDALQELALKALSSPASFDSYGDKEMQRAVRNMRIDLYRKDMPHRNVPLSKVAELPLELQGEALADMNGPDRWCEAEALAAGVTAKLKLETDSTSTSIVKMAFEGYTSQEMGARLGISPALARKRLQFLRTRLAA